jgi:hypothetical protein
MTRVSSESKRERNNLRAEMCNNSQTRLKKLQSVRIQKVKQALVLSVSNGTNAHSRTEQIRHLDHANREGVSCLLLYYKSVYSSCSGAVRGCLKPKCLFRIA